MECDRCGKILIRIVWNWGNKPHCYHCARQRCFEWSRTSVGFPERTKIEDFYDYEKEE